MNKILFGLILFSTHCLADTDRFLGPRDEHNLITAIEDYIKHNDSVFQYGNWYGTKNNEQLHTKLPIDSLDAIAQKHNFAYQIAEQQSKIYGSLEEKRLKSIADYLAVRDAKALPENPKAWILPANDVNKAARYRDRMVTGFNEDISDNSDTTINKDLNWATAPIEQWRLDKTHQLTASDLENHISALQKDWNTKHFPPLAKPDTPTIEKQTNTTTPQDDKKTNKQLENDPDYLEFLRLSDEMMQLTHSVMEQANAGKKPDNSTLNKIKTLESRISALSKRIESNYSKKQQDNQNSKPNLEKP